MNEFMSGNYYEEEFKFLRKERSWTSVKFRTLHIMYICKTLYTKICNTHIDRFRIQFNLVQIMDLWNVNYAIVTVVPHDRKHQG